MAITEAEFLLQIDDVSLPGRHRILVPADGPEAFVKQSGLAVDAVNHALRGIPVEKVRYHMFWSSMNAHHTDDPPLSELTDALVRINAQGYQIEAANVRHEHENHVREDVKQPEDKILMPGIIGHAPIVIEHSDYVCDRILRYAKAVGRHRVIAATDCGFRWRVHP